LTFRTGRNEEAGRKIQDIFKFFIFGPGQRQQCGHSAPEAAADVATVVAPVSPCRKAPSPNHPLHVFFFFCPLSAVLAFGSASLMQIRSAAQLSPRMQNNKTVKSRQEQAATAKGTMAEREGHSAEEREGTNNT